MAKSYSRGHEIEYDENDAVWYYTDNGFPLSSDRACKRCGRAPIDDHDVCIGYVEGLSSACCGHGITRGFKMEKESFGDEKNNNSRY